MIENKIKDAFYKYLDNPDLEQDKLLSILEKTRQQWLQLRQNEHDNLWRQNISFYSGNHYIRDTGRNANQYRVKLRENHTNNVINRMVSIFVQNLPVTRIFPASTDYEDEQKAETTELYAKYFWRTKKMEQQFTKLLKYTAITGNGFIFRQYDPYAGGRIQMDESEIGEQKIDVFHGDVKIDVDDPFRIVVRPGIDELDDMHDIIRSIPANKQEIEAIYGEVDSEPATSLNAYNGQLRTDDDILMVHHYYHKPTHWFEDGMYVCWAGKKILKAIKYPYTDGLLPVVHLPFDKPPMRFWALSEVDQIIDLQEQVNRAASMIVEARNLLARPRVLVSNEAQVPGQSITDRPGDIIRYKMAGGPPKFEVPNFNFTEMANHKADVRSALQAVSGITGASRGEIPAATRTALALQLVLEMDRSQWSPFVKTFYQCIQDTMLGVLGIAAQYFSEEDPRVIKIEHNNIVGSRAFHGGMVPSPLDIWLEDTNPLGWTAAGRIEAIQSLVQMGAIKDEHKVLEMLKLNNTDPAMAITNVNRQSALKENEEFNRGIMLDIMPEDDDAVHLDEHTKPVASFEFRSKPKAVQDAYIAHIEQHKQRVQSVMAPQQQQTGAGESAAKGLGEVAQINKPVMPGSNLQELLGK
jgi:hypothetical protein